MRIFASRSTSGHQVPLWPLAISLVASAGILMIATAVTFDLRREVGARAEESAGNLLRVIERDIARNIEMLDLSLQAIVEGVGRADVMASDPSLRQLMLFDRAGSATGIGRLAAFDTSGSVIAEEGTSDAYGQDAIVGQEYFQAQRQPGLGLYISRPFRSSGLNEPVVALSRRISDRDGAFAGVALATIRISYFADLLAKLKLGPNGLVSLVRQDGAVVVRHGPAARRTDDLSGSNTFRRIREQQAGAFVAVSSLDGVERLYTFTQVGRLPLHLSVALATEDIYAEWKSKAELVGAVLGLICLSILGLTAVLTRELYRRARAERKLVHANMELARLSITDALTELGNRRQFDRCLAREIRRTERTGERLSLLLLDVDHFKLFNDRYGHQQGDAVLREVGRILRRCASRPGDAAFRVGGEEFAVILPGTPAAGAARVGDIIRTEVRALKQPHSGSVHDVVTVSLGALEIAGHDSAAAYAEADAALYEAKGAGRDRVVLHGPKRLAA